MAIAPTLNIPQAKFLAMQYKFKAYVAGFGSGKTWVGCGGICKGMWEHPKINQGYFAPTYPQIRDIFYPTVEEVAHDWGLNVKINEGNKEVHFYAGRQYRGTTICRSMEKPQTIVGFKIGNALIDELDVMPAKKAQLSTLDNRTSKDCRIRDRLKYTLDNKPIGHKVPYLQGPGKIHFCCRSVETYILKSSDELGIAVGQISDSSRASMNGQVPSDTDYQGWFSRQSFTRQSQIVGVTRARLIRDGGMSPDDFYNDKGEWLTLEQLRNLDAQAFSNARL